MFGTQLALRSQVLIFYQGPPFDLAVLFLAVVNHELLLVPLCEQVWLPWIEQGGLLRQI